MTRFDFLKRLDNENDQQMFSPFERAVIERLDSIHSTARWIRIFLVAVILAVAALLVVDLPP